MSSFKILQRVTLFLTASLWCASTQASCGSSDGPFDHDTAADVNNVALCELEGLCNRIITLFGQGSVQGLEGPAVIHMGKFSKNSIMNAVIQEIVRNGALAEFAKTVVPALQKIILKFESSLAPSELNIIKSELNTYFSIFHFMDLQDYPEILHLLRKIYGAEISDAGFETEIRSRLRHLITRHE